MINLSESKEFINQDDFAKSGHTLDFGDYFSPNFRNEVRKANGQVVIPLSPFVPPQTKIFFDDNPNFIFYRAFQAFPYPVKQKIRLEMPANTNMTQTNMNSVFVTKPENIRILVLPSMSKIPHFSPKENMFFELTWLPEYQDKFFEIYGGNVLLEFEAFTGDTASFQIGYDDKSTVIFDYVSKSIIYRSVQHKIPWNHFNLGKTSNHLTLKAYVT